MSESTDASTALKAQLMRNALAGARARIMAQSFTRWRVTANFLSEIAKAPQEGLKMHLMEYKYKFNALNKKMESYEREVNAARSELARQEISMAQERRSLLEQIEIARREGGGAAPDGDDAASLSWLNKVSERSLAERTRQALFGRMHRFGSNRAQIKQSAERVLAAMDDTNAVAVVEEPLPSSPAPVQPDSISRNSIGSRPGHGSLRLSSSPSVQSNQGGTPTRAVSMRGGDLKTASANASPAPNTASTPSGPSQPQDVEIEMEEYIVAQRNVIAYLTLKNALRTLADHSSVPDVRKAFYKWMSISFVMVKGALASKAAEVDSWKLHYETYEGQMKEHWEKTETYTKSLTEELNARTIEYEEAKKQLEEAASERDEVASKLNALEQQTASNVETSAANGELENKIVELNKALDVERRQSFVSGQSLVEASKALAEEKRRNNEKAELISKLTVAISGLGSNANAPGDASSSAQTSGDQMLLAEDEQFYSWMTPNSKSSAIDSLKLLSLRPSDAGRKSSTKPKERGRSRSMYVTTKEAEPLFTSSSMRRSSISGSEESGVDKLPPLPPSEPSDFSRASSLSASVDSFDVPGASKQDINSVVFNPDIESAMNSKILTPNSRPAGRRSLLAGTESSSAQSRAAPSTPVAEASTPRRSSASAVPLTTPPRSESKPAALSKQQSKSKVSGTAPERTRNQGLQTADDFESSLEDVWRTISSTKVDSTPMSTNVRVAVRMRPLNARETEMGSQRVVSMEGNTVRLIEDMNTGTDHQFSYDFCFDASELNESKSTAGAQKMVFDRLGMEVLSHAWSGYNACLFAYGQTGSGKSYSMMGNATDAGIIPRVCRALFYMISRQGDSDNESGIEPRHISVEADYLEIYNENIRDLLDSTRNNLRVREHPTTGVFVENLSSCAVESYEDVEDLLAMGLEQRTTAATNMNSESSRSHSVFTISIRSSGYDENGNLSQKDVRLSKLRLVDLAGSERASATGATGARLKEGANINKSLSTLGRCISALAKMNSKKGNPPNTVIPFRESTLTWLLRESLCGNAKTSMIATVSPAHVYVGETLSTLRYAYSAKQIATQAVINEDPTAKIISDLRNEVQRLRSHLLQSLESSKGSASYGLQESLRNAETALKSYTNEWEEKQQFMKNIRRKVNKSCISTFWTGNDDDDLKSTPYFVFLSDDPQLNMTVKVYLRSQSTLNIGRTVSQISGAGEDADPNVLDLQIEGVGIEDLHCKLVNSGGAIAIKSQPEACTYVNGKLLMAAGFDEETEGFVFNTKDKEIYTDVTRRRSRNMLDTNTTSSDIFDDWKSQVLSPGDRIVLGECSHVFLYVTPEMNADMEAGKSALPTYTQAIREVILGRVESIDERKRRLALRVYRLWNRPQSKRAFEDSFIDTLKSVREVSKMTYRLCPTKKIFFKASVTSLIDISSLFTLSVSDLFDYDNLTIRVRCYQVTSEKEVPSSLSSPSKPPRRMSVSLGNFAASPDAPTESNLRMNRIVSFGHGEAPSATTLAKLFDKMKAADAAGASNDTSNSTTAISNSYVYLDSCRVIFETSLTVFNEGIIVLRALYAVLKPLMSYLSKVVDSSYDLSFEASKRTDLNNSLELLLETVLKKLNANDQYSGIMARQPVDEKTELRDVLRTYRDGLRAVECALIDVGVRTSNLGALCFKKANEVECDMFDNIPSCIRIVVEALNECVINAVFSCFDSNENLVLDGASSGLDGSTSEKLNEIRSLLATAKSFNADPTSASFESTASVDDNTDSTAVPSQDSTVWEGSDDWVVCVDESTGAKYIYSEKLHESRWL